MQGKAEEKAGAQPGLVSQWESMIGLLLRHGANPAVMNLEGFSPLHLAARSGLDKYG